MTGSYKTIGKAVGMSQNTVRKYVMALEEKGLIRTESTSVRPQSGQMRNGSLLYTIRPMQEALDLFYERQMEQAETAVAKQRATAKLAAVSPCDGLWGALTPTEENCPTQGNERKYEPLLGEVQETKEKAG